MPKPVSSRDVASKTFDGSFSKVPTSIFAIGDPLESSPRDLQNTRYSTYLRYQYFRQILEGVLHFFSPRRFERAIRKRPNFTHFLNFDPKTEVLKFALDTPIRALDRNELLGAQVLST